MTKKKAIATPYEPTPRELDVKDAYVARKQRQPPRMKVSEKDGVKQIRPDHPDAAMGYMLIAESLGTVDEDFVGGLLTQLANVGTQGQDLDEEGLNFLLAVVKGVEPQDQVEAMLGAQMAAIHNAVMTFARRLAHVDNLPRQDSAERALNKLCRTLCALVEALNRHRGKGQQTVTVEHVHVNAGGQAIVGTVNRGGGGNTEKRG